MEVDLPSVTDVMLGDDETGLCVLVKLRGRPVDFFLCDPGGRKALSSATVDSIVGSRSAVAIIRQSIEDGLSRGVAPEREQPPQ